MSIKVIAQALSDADGQYVQPQEWHYDEAATALISIREPSPHAIAKAADAMDISPTLAYAVWVTMVDFMLKEDEK